MNSVFESKNGNLCVATEFKGLIPSIIMNDKYKGFFERWYENFLDGVSLEEIKRVMRQRLIGTHIADFYLKYLTDYFRDYFRDAKFFDNFIDAVVNALVSDAQHFYCHLNKATQYFNILCNEVDLLSFVQRRELLINEIALCFVCYSKIKHYNGLSVFLLIEQI